MYEILPEYSLPDGQIDIAIKSIDYEIYIENKISSDLSDSQLERYSKHLESINKATKLILITRDFIEDKRLSEKTNFRIFQLYGLNGLGTKFIQDFNQ